MKNQKLTKATVIKNLRNLVKSMLDVGSDMARFVGESEVVKHGEELVAAAMMEEEWANVFESGPVATPHKEFIDMWLDIYRFNVPVSLLEELCEQVADATRLRVKKAYTAVNKANKAKAKFHQERAPGCSNYEDELSAHEARVAKCVSELTTAARKGKK